MVDRLTVRPDGVVMALVAGYRFMGEEGPGRIGGDVEVVAVGFQCACVTGKAAMTGVAGKGAFGGVRGAEPGEDADIGSAIAAIGMTVGSGAIGIVIVVGLGSGSAGGQRAPGHVLSLVRMERLVGDQPVTGINDACMAILALEVEVVEARAAVEVMGTVGVFYHGTGRVFVAAMTATAVCRQRCSPLGCIAVMTVDITAAAVAVAGGHIAGGAGVFGRGGSCRLVLGPGNPLVSNAELPADTPLDMGAVIGGMADVA